MNRKLCLTLLAFAAVAVMATGSYAGVSATQLPIVDSWPGSPVLQTTATPDTDSTVSNGGPGNGVALTITTSAGFQLRKFSIVAAGGPSDVLVQIYKLTAGFEGGTEADGHAQLGFAPQLLGGGTPLPFTFFGTATENILEFDLTGSDQITLDPNSLYAIDFTPDPNDTGYNFYVRRGGAFYTDGGNIYASAASGTDRFDVAGGRRDAPLALYAVPEPTTLAMLALLAGTAPLWRRRRLA